MNLLGLAVDSRMDLYSVWIPHQAKRFFSHHYLRNCSISDTGVFGYTKVNKLKKCSPEFWHIPTLSVEVLIRAITTQLA